MWRNVKVLEDDNKRLRKELEEWVDRALELSKRLHAGRACAQNAASSAGAKNASACNPAIAVCWLATAACSALTVAGAIAAALSASLFAAS